MIDNDHSAKQRPKLDSLEWSLNPDEIRLVQISALLNRLRLERPSLEVVTY